MASLVEKRVAIPATLSLTEDKERCTERLGLARLPLRVLLTVWNTSSRLDAVSGSVAADIDICLTREEKPPRVPLEASGRSEVMETLPSPGCRRRLDRMESPRSILSLVFDFPRDGLFSRYELLNGESIFSDASPQSPLSGCSARELCTCCLSS